LKIVRARRAWPALSLPAILAAQRDRLILWAPMALMAGAALYFTAPQAPPWQAGPLALLAGAGLALAAAAWPARGFWGGVRMALICAGLAGASGALGFIAGDLRERAVAAPTLAHETAPVSVEGWVVDLDRGASRPRLTLRVRSVEGVAHPPLLVRISTTEAGALTPGRAARCRAILHPPDGPMAPGAYDGAFDLHFARIGATGFSLGACHPIALSPPREAFAALALQALALRRAVTETVLYAAPGRGGAVAAAMITGDRAAIDADTTLVFRNSGLAHMLSVSGFHMSLVAGMLYAGAHIALALLPGFALRFPIRKWAAGFAIVGAGLYLVLSGLSVPAQRAYVMTAVVLGAILVDRPAITMRGLAAAAFIVTLLAPESVLTPGFQMSFAATAALVAAFEMYQGARQRLPTPGLFIAGLQAFARWMGGALLASAVAGFATDPFALAHFQRFSLYALPANLAATPIISLIVTPAAGAAALAAPFGLADAPLAVMGWGLDLLVSVGAVFADRPEAIRALPKPPDIALVFWTASIAWACLWRGPLRLAAAPLFLAGLALYAAAPRPILYADGALQAVIARAAEEGRPRWIAVSGRGADFERERLGELAGLSPRESDALAPPQACGGAYCRWTSPAGRPVFVLQPHADPAPACVRGAIVIARSALPPSWAARCAPGALISADTLAHAGGAAVYETKAGVRVARARAGDHRRAWDGALTDSSE
jgi:competence protein ComEC